jgi:hypothetical protein
MRAAGSVVGFHLETDTTKSTGAQQRLCHPDPLLEAVAARPSGVEEPKAAAGRP